MGLRADAPPVQALRGRKSRGFRQAFADCPPEAVDVLRRLLVFDPRARPAAAEVLRLPFFARFHSPAEETVCARPIRAPIPDSSRLSLKAYRDALYENISQHLRQAQRPAPREDAPRLSCLFRKKSSANCETAVRRLKSPGDAPLRQLVSNVGALRANRPTAVGASAARAQKEAARSGFLHERKGSEKTFDRNALRHGKPLSLKKNASLARTQAGGEQARRGGTAEPAAKGEFSFFKKKSEQVLLRQCHSKSDFAGLLNSKKICASKLSSTLVGPVIHIKQFMLLILYIGCDSLFRSNKS